ncbi:MAG: Unknown protein [uncultured Sulfurovum sp.]|uniref:Uncharacterized protein n=1 Tax=uncultured Sulfurovum sp. TaxID=269237 RepID=A0A6S6SJG3_9BACT|nr:MAG: Unknown protein [uncultured Sulfurovum sp.]
MKRFIHNQKIIVKIIVIMMLLNVLLFAEVVKEKQVVETVEVSLDSFGLLSIIVLVAITSLLGMYFMKDEFSNLS